MFLLAPEANLPRPAPVLAVPAGNWQVKVGIAVPTPDVTLLTEHSGTGLQVLSPNVVVFTRAKLVNVRAALPAEELGRTTSVTDCVSPLANVPMPQLKVLLRGNERRHGDGDDDAGRRLRRDRDVADDQGVGHRAFPGADRLVAAHGRAGDLGDGQVWLHRDGAVADAAAAVRGVGVTFQRRPGQ
jgi:hypothetical protein